MLRLNKKYFPLAAILFILEVLIALFAKDRFIRPYVGDYLVVTLIYCTVKAVLKAPVWKAAVGTLLFAYLIEILQYFSFLAKIGLENNALARLVIGYGFEWVDILAYTLGIVTVLVFENRKKSYVNS